MHISIFTDETDKLPLDINIRIDPIADDIEFSEELTGVLEVTESQDITDIKELLASIAESVKPRNYLQTIESSPIGTDTKACNHEWGKMAENSAGTSYHCAICGAIKIETRITQSDEVTTSFDEPQQPKLAPIDDGYLWHTAPQFPGIIE